MSEATRVLIITSVYPRWQGDATPAFVQSAAQDLASAGYEVRVLAPHFPGCPVESLEGSVSIHRHRYLYPESLQTLCYEGGMIVRLRQKKSRAIQLPFFALSQFLAIKGELRRFRPHLVHAHSLLPQGWLTAEALGNKSSVPFLISSHGNDVFGLQGRLEKLKAQAAQRASALIANSHATSEALLKFAPKEKISTIYASPNQRLASEPGAIESLRKKLDGENRKLLLFAGRLIPEKGIGLLLDILPELQQRCGQTKLIITGSGPLESLVKQNQISSKNPDAIEFLGWTPSEEIPTLFAAVDCVAVPSQPLASGWTEAHGLVAVEAMAVGTPVVASRLGGLAESTIDQQTGFLVDPTDRAAWINTLAKTLTASPEQKRSWGEAAKLRFAQNYSREANLAQTCQLYQKLLKATP